METLTGRFSSILLGLCEDTVGFHELILSSAHLPEELHAAQSTKKLESKARKVLKKPES